MSSFQQNITKHTKKGRYGGRQAGNVQCVFHEVGERWCVGEMEKAHVVAEGTRAVSRAPCPSIPWALLRYTSYRELALRQVPWKGFVYIGSSRVTHKNSEADPVSSPLFG